MREQLFQLNQMMEEVVRVRKSIMDRRLVETEDGAGDGNEIIFQIKKELMNLRDKDLDLSSITLLRDNMKRFKEFMERSDSFSLVPRPDQSYRFENDLEHEDLKNIKKLKDVLSRPSGN